MLTPHALEFITPTTHTLVVGAHTYQVAPLKVRDLPAILAHLKPALLDLVGGQLDALSMVQALADHSGSLVDCVAICVQAEKSLIEDMQADAFMALALLCVEVNLDFFTQALARLKGQQASLAPTLSAMLAKQLAGQVAGQMASASTPAPSPS